jgi:hypothetical protein
MKTFLGVGNVYRLGPQSLKFSVDSVKNLKVIIDHFEKYPLITKKRADYELFVQTFNLIQNKEHLTEEGLRKIVATKANMNLGLSDELKTAFPNIIPVLRPSSVLEDCQIQDPNWFAGFVTGEGCFHINIKNSASHSLGFQVQLIFKLTQHTRDEQLMKSLIEYLDSGNVYIFKEAVNYLVIKFTDLTDKIIPFFQKYQIKGAKYYDFEDFYKVAELMKNKVHLTQEGLDQIRQIKAGMNRGREY